MGEWLSAEDAETLFSLEFLGERAIETTLKVKEYEFNLDSPILEEHFQVPLSHIYTVSHHIRVELWEHMVPTEFARMMENCPEDLKHIWEVAFTLGFLTSQQAGRYIEEME